MMNKVKCGELVYIPSQTTLFRLDESENVEDYSILKMTFLLLILILTWRYWDGMAIQIHNVRFNSFQNVMNWSRSCCSRGKREEGKDGSQ